jgi:hypothetical protein
MKSLPRIFVLLLASGLAACDKQSTPSQADMNAAARQKAIEVRENADKETVALNEGVAKKAVAEDPAPTAAATPPK